MCWRPRADRSRSTSTSCGPSRTRGGTVELTETSCGAEACADGCGAHVDCRVWTHQGEQYTEAPVALIVDALLREVYSDPRPADPDEGVIGPYEVPENCEPTPENLQRFFRANQRTDVSRARPDATPEGEKWGASRLLLARGRGRLLRPGREGDVLPIIDCSGLRLSMMKKGGWSDGHHNGLAGAA